MSRRNQQQFDPTTLANESRCAETAQAPPWAWAIFLAVSWTWCIGMFLPAILIRDMGLWVFAVFAIPNIIGAGLVGWTDLADRLRRRHTSVVRAFSLVTIAFQAFFAAVLISRLGPIAGSAVLAAFVGVWAIITLRRSPLGPTQAVFAISIAAGLAILWSLGMPPSAGIASAATTELSANTNEPNNTHNLTALFALAPVVAFGFLLCPPLDATFQHVRTQTRGPHEPVNAWGSRRTQAAFTLGFALFFPLLIALTPIYAPLARGLMLEQGYIAPGIAALAALAAHLICQLAATGALHARVQMRDHPPMRDGVLAALAVGVAAAVLARILPAMFGLTGVELVYRAFMAAYGLAFPAYAWIVLWTDRRTAHTTAHPTAQPPPSPPRPLILVWIGVCLAAAPFYFAGFMLRQEVWLVPGLAVALLGGPIARILLKRINTENNDRT